MMAPRRYNILLHMTCCNDNDIVILITASGAGAGAGTYCMGAGAAAGAAAYDWGPRCGTGCVPPVPVLSIIKILLRYGISYGKAIR